MRNIISKINSTKWRKMTALSLPLACFCFFVHFVNLFMDTPVSVHNIGVNNIRLVFLVVVPKNSMPLCVSLSLYVYYLLNV